MIIYFYTNISRKLIGYGVLDKYSVGIGINLIKVGTK